jgi:hypothetical protein
VSQIDPVKNEIRISGEILKWRHEKPLELLAIMDANRNPRGQQCQGSN